MSSRRSAGSTSAHLVPAQAARHARVGRRAHRVGGGDGAVAGVLVVVDEHAVALLLPPLARRAAPARAARPPAPARAPRGALPSNAVLRTIAHVDVDALASPRSSGSRAGRAPAGPRRDHQRRSGAPRPRSRRPRVEIDAQLVGMVEVRAAHGVRVAVDHAEVDRPRQVRLVVGHQLLRRAARRGTRPSSSAATPAGSWARASARSGRSIDPVDEALHHRRALAQVDQDGVRGGQVVLDEVELGPAGLGEVDLAGVGEADLVARHLEHRVLALGHLPRSLIASGHGELACAGPPRARR